MKKLLAITLLTAGTIGALSFSSVQTHAMQEVQKPQAEQSIPATLAEAIESFPARTDEELEEVFGDTPDTTKVLRVGEGFSIGDGEITIEDVNDPTSVKHYYPTTDPNATTVGAIKEAIRANR